MKSILKCMVLICCLSFLNALKFRCDYRYTPQGWFKYHEIPAEWADARLRCQLEGGILASPTTPEIKFIMNESLCKPEIIFTGLHSLFTKGYYTTIDGIPLDEIKHEWAPLEPDNKNDSERCIALHSEGFLSDVSCDEPRPYICFRPPSTDDVGVCGTPDPEYYFSEKTNKCYKFHTNPRQFERAQFACTAEGGHLVVINSEDENNYLYNLYAQYGRKMIPGNHYMQYAYVGIHSWNESIDWSTIHGQPLKEIGYTIKWDSGQPNSIFNYEFCGSLRANGYMHDGGCDLHMVFICEKRPDFPKVCDTETATNKVKRKCNKGVQEQENQVTIDPRNSVNEKQQEQQHVL